MALELFDRERRSLLVSPHNERDLKVLLLERVGLRDPSETILVPHGRVRLSVADQRRIEHALRQLNVLRMWWIAPAP